MKYSLVLALSCTAATVHAAPMIHPVNAALVTTAVGTPNPAQVAPPNIDAHGGSTWEHIAVLKNVHVNLGGLGSTSNDKHYKRSPRGSGGRGGSAPGRPSHVARPSTSSFRSSGSRNPAIILAPLATANGVDKADDDDKKKSTSSKVANKLVKLSTRRMVKKPFKGSKEEHDCYEDETEEECKARIEKEKAEKNINNTNGRNFKKLPVMPNEKVNMKREPLLIHTVDPLGGGREFKELPVQPKVNA